MPNRHNLTDEQVEQSVAAFRARMEGLPYQVISNEKWLTVYQAEGIPIWDDDTPRRPVPAKRIIPFTRDTLPTLPFEVRSRNGNRYCVVAALYDNVKTGQGAEWSYQQLLETFTFPDGRPCGQEVEG